MTRSMSRSRRLLPVVAAVLLIGLAVPVIAAPQAGAPSASPSAADIVRRLSDPAPDLPTMRGIKVLSGKAAVPHRPTIDLAVNFEFGSAALTAEGEQLLDTLGTALEDPKLETSRFRIAGHTDAVGSAAYNEALSVRRAEAVRRYLVEHHGVAAARLAATGYGLTRLLDPANPTSAVNRRVEITNIGKAP